MIKIALTGGIACGKSMVQKHLEALNVPILDADDVSRDLYLHDTELKEQIRDEFGGVVFEADGSVNRSKVSNLAFKAPERLKKLMEWIHPKVRESLAEFFKTQLENQEKFAIAVIPILYESKLEGQYDEVWVVKASREQQIERLLGRSEAQGRSMTLEQAEERLNSQMPLKEKIKRADWVIDNSGTIAETEAQLSKKIMDLRA